MSVTFFRTGRTLAKIKMSRFTFVDFDICHRMGSLQKLYSVILIFDFKCLKYVKFVRFRMLPEAKIMKKFSNTRSQIWGRTAQVPVSPP